MQFGEFVTVDEAARIVGKTYRTVWGYIKRNGVNVEYAGKTALVRVQDVLAIKQPKSMPEQVQEASRGAHKRKEPANNE